jgi:hypothetical protein
MNSCVTSAAQFLLLTINATHLKSQSAWHNKTSYFFGVLSRKKIKTKEIQNVSEAMEEQSLYESHSDSTTTT